MPHSLVELSEPLHSACYSVRIGVGCCCRAEISVGRSADTRAVAGALVRGVEAVCAFAAYVDTLGRTGYDVHDGGGHEGCFAFAYSAGCHFGQAGLRPAYPTMRAGRRSRPHSIFRDLVISKPSWIYLSSLRRYFPGFSNGHSCSRAQWPNFLHR